MAYKTGFRGSVLGVVTWQLAGRARSPGSIPSNRKRFIPFWNLRPTLGFSETTIEIVPTSFSSGIKRIGRKADSSFLSGSEDKNKLSCVWFYDVHKDYFYLYLDTRR